MRATTTLKIRRTLILVLLLLVGTQTTRALGKGDVARFEFSNLPFLEFLPDADNSFWLYFNYGSDMLNLGESMAMDLFADTTNDPPFFSFFVDPESSAYLWPGWSNWSDLQGVIQVRMLEGSADLTEIGLNVVRPDGVFGEIIVVPEASSWAFLILTAALVLGGRNAWRKNRFGWETAAARARNFRSVLG